MLKIPISTTNDINEAAKLRRRIQFEEERRKRIFNSKQRLIGLDVHALEQQIAEKSKQRQFEADCERRYAEQARQQQMALYDKSVEMEKRKRVLEGDLNNYRLYFQRMDQRREFDLNDPNFVKKSLPARIADDDSRLGISSAQIFCGEDLYHNERQRRQRAQQRAWLEQQIRERKQAEEARIKADLVLQESMECRDKRLEDMANSEFKVRNQMIDSIQEFNSQLAKAKKHQRMLEKQEKNEDDLAEIYNMLTSDILTENPDVAKSKTNPNKKIPFMYRGMTPDELQKIQETQIQQKLANKKRQTEQQLMEKQWDQYAINMDHQLQLKQLELEGKHKEYLSDRVRFNKNLAVQQKAQNSYNNEMNKNYISEKFYDPFNKTSR